VGKVKGNKFAVEFMYDVEGRSSSGPSSFQRIIKDVKRRLSNNETVPKIVSHAGEKYGSVAIRTDHGSLSLGSMWEGHKYSFVKQIPPLIDASLLKDYVLKNAQNTDERVRAYQKTNMFSGAVVTQIDKVIRDEVLFQKYLENLSDRKAKVKSEIFYGEDVGDQHIGDNFLSMPPGKFQYKTTLELYYENFPKIVEDLINGPITYSDDVGDRQQGKHFQTEIEENPNFLSPMEIEDEIKKMKSHGVADEKINDFMIKNAKLTPITTLKQQNEEMFRIIGTDHYKGILKEAKKYGLTGPVVVLIDGNHERKTTKYVGEVLSEYFATRIRDKTGASEDKVMAPMLGALSIANFHRGKPGHKQYNFYVKHKHTTTKQEDLMFGMREENEKRAEHHDIVKGGHAHLDGHAIVDGTVYILNKTWQDRNAWGEEFSFRLPTIGSRFTGLPVDGFEYGPVVFVEVTSDYIHKYAKKD
jgi:hypothetical protein